MNDYTADVTPPVGNACGARLTLYVKRQVVVMLVCTIRQQIIHSEHEVILEGAVVKWS